MSGMLLRGTLTLVVGISVWVAPARAASGLSDGMQRYFAGDYAVARDVLSASIETGVSDARLYYFRGLANYQLGDRAAAGADFRLGAEVEMRSGSPDLGRVLERVQGLARLELEKHRGMARLKARNRRQSPAPRPISRATDDSSPASQSLSIEETMRLASELPVAFSWAANPFVDDGQLVMPAASIPVVDPLQSANEPVGTGVAAAAGSTYPEPVAESDPFGEWDDASADVEPSPASATNAATDGESTRGIWGAMIRAIGKAAIPQVDPSRVLPSVLPGPPGEVRGAPAEQPAALDQRPQSPPSGDKPADADPFGDDPFGDR